MYVRTAGAIIDEERERGPKGSRRDETEAERAANHQPIGQLREECGPRVECGPPAETALRSAAGPSPGRAGCFMYI